MRPKDAQGPGFGAGSEPDLHSAVRGCSGPQGASSEPGPGTGHWVAQARVAAGGNSREETLFTPQTLGIRYSGSSGHPKAILEFRNGQQIVTC